ncbi:DUF6663 family protein [Halohasta salina]|uniref:DUF6663 family protein n=1 Tax=Halohasta salina TaxID=2961621 RepID=UPI0020A5EDFE|nr:DUF6663 family protein [Halohasta salina]
MEPTTTGRFRVLDRRPDGRLLLVDLDEAVAAVEDDDTEADLQPLAAVPPASDDDLAETVRDLKPGYEVTASLSWDDSEARFVDCAVDGRTWIQYADGVSGLFEAAQETWYDAQMAGEAMNSRLTYSTDNEPNGVVYTFAKQTPPQDLFEEFRTGATPIEPLIQRVEAERDDSDDRAVFVMNPVDEEFVLIYIVFRKDGMLAETVRDTYGLPPL